jgi:choline kinase
MHVFRCLLIHLTDSVGLESHMRRVLDAKIQQILMLHYTYISYLLDGSVTLNEIQMEVLGNNFYSKTN